MTLCLKSIYNGNLNDKPFFSKNNKEKWLDIMKNNSNDSFEMNENDLMILCLQNVYGYRTGIFGYFATLLTNKLTECFPQTFIIKSICNYLMNSKLICNDLEALSGVISIINRTVPFLNYGRWDNKSFFSKKLNLFRVNDDDDLLKGMFDFYSNFLFKHFFDSGLCILSNKKCNEFGFEKLKNPGNSFVNEGFLWCCFKDEKKIIFIITFNISSNEENKFDEIIQLLDLKDDLLLKFPSHTNEIYIIGDFKTNISKHEYLFKNVFKMSKNNDNTLCLIYKNNVYRTPMTNTFNNNDDEGEENNYLQIFNFNKKRNLSPLQRILQIKKIKIEKEKNTDIIVNDDSELKEIVITEPDDISHPIERNDDAEKIMMYKKLSMVEKSNLNIITNPVENYFYKPQPDTPDSKTSILNTDEEWTKINKDEIKI